MWDNIQLEPFQDVLKKQVPLVPGQPIPMTVFTTDMPKGCGSPFKGAYSKHGLWYKIMEGGEDDYKKLVALSYEQDRYLLSYEDYSQFKRNCDRVMLLVAKNLRGDVMGGVLSLVRRKTVHLGAFFVQEDYRHSGIGSQLFGLSLMSFEYHEAVFNSMHHLHPTLSSFGLQPQVARKMLHYTLDRPEGYPKLQSSQDLLLRKAADLTLLEKKKLAVFLQDVTGYRPLDDYPHEGTLIAFENEKCVGFGTRSEPAGGTVRRILIAPLFAADSRVAEAILKELLSEYYNPEDDYDFDPDPLAVYRREVHFFVPELNPEMLVLLEKLADDPKKVTKQRMWCQTASTALLPGARLSRVFACNNPHFYTV